MAAPSSRHLVRAGGLFAMLLLLLAVLAARVPAAFAPATHAYALSVSVEQGLVGLRAGSTVLLGGIDVGKVERITSTVESHEVHFTVDQRYPLFANALIRKDVAITGTGGTLFITSLGSHDHPLAADEPLSLIASGSGAAAALGPRAAASIASLQIHASHAGPRLIAMNETIRSSIDEMRSTLTGLGTMTPELHHLPDDLDRLKAELKKFTPPEIIESTATLLRTRLDAIKLHARAMQVATDQRRVEVENAMEVAKESLALAKSLLARFKRIAPHATATLQRAKAQSVLAGGQLSRLTSSIIQEGLLAIFVKPNNTSWSQRQALEATEDVLQASTSLQQSTAFLDALATSNADAETTMAVLEQSLSLLNKHLERLFELLTNAAP